MVTVMEVNVALSGLEIEAEESDGHGRASRNVRRVPVRRSD